MFWKIFFETATAIVLIVLLSWLIYKLLTRQSPAGDD